MPLFFNYSNSTLFLLGFQILMNARPIPAVMAPGALTSTVPTCVTVPVGGPAHCVP